MKDQTTPVPGAPKRHAGTIYEELERLAPDHLRRRPVRFLVSYKGKTYTAEWLSPGRWHVWEPEHLVIPPPGNPYLITPEGDIPEHYVCKDCGHGRPVTIVPPLGWVMCDTYWLCPVCADRRATNE